MRNKKSCEECKNKCTPLCKYCDNDSQVKANKEELYKAVRLITEHCSHSKGCPSCELHWFCYDKIMLDAPEPFAWPDPEVGGGEDG